MQSRGGSLQNFGSYFLLYCNNECYYYCYNATICSPGRMSEMDSVLYSSAVIVVFGLGGWLGKVWSDRIARTEKSVLEAEIIRINAEYKTLQEKSIYIHRLQFEREFEAYSKIWKEALPLYDIAVAMRPFAESVPEGVDFIDHKHSQMQKLRKLYTIFANVFRNNRPFYSEKVYQACLDVQNLVKREHNAVRRFEKDNRIDPKTFYEEGDKAAEELVKQLDNICNEIRKRVSSVILSQD